MCDKSELEYQINVLNLSYEFLGQKYGVSGCTIKRWAKKMNIPLKPRRKINKNESFNKDKHLKPVKVCTCMYCGENFELKPNRSGKFCSIQCSEQYKSIERYKKYLKDPSPYMYDRSMKQFKKFILEEQNHKCAICGIEDIWNGKPLVFILDHIDGHAINNCRENLRLICSNCDSQLDTYKSKNKNSDRTYHKRYYNREIE